jgi:hypothetical protein
MKELTLHATRLNRLIEEKKDSAIEMRYIIVPEKRNWRTLTI